MPEFRQELSFYVQVIHDFSDKLITTDLTNTNWPTTRDWIDSFVVPYAKFPTPILQKCNNGEQISRAEGRIVVRLVSAEVMQFSMKPGKHNLKIIAKDIVTKYPATFQDRVSTTVVGGGYTTLLNQLTFRIENQNRPSSVLSKRKIKQGENPKRMVLCETYGCLRFLPDYPPKENESTQNVKKEQLKKLYPLKNVNAAQIRTLMDETFVSQRVSIIYRTSISDVTDEWPFLTVSKFLLGHFEELMGFDITKKFDAASKEKIPELISFLRSGSKGDPVNSLYTYISRLCTYFKEEENYILKIVPETTSPSDVLTIDGLPVTPLIVSFGDPYALEKTCIIVIEKSITSEFMNIKDAISAWFCSYYVYNLKYPAEIAATLEFIQRVFVEINPEKGSKQTKKPGRSCKVDSKVLRLVKQLGSH